MNRSHTGRRGTSSAQDRLTGFLVRLVVVAVVALLTVGLASQGSANAVAAPVPVPPVAYQTEPEPLAKYVGQITCTTKVPAGTAKLKALLVETYGPVTIGTLRGCSVGARSEHKDGRALDFMLNVNVPAERAKANAFLSWLIGPDEQGVTAGNARRLGVMYLIWNKYSWDAYDSTPKWEPYTGPNPHTDHIHISLSWDGALGRTSFWTGKATTKYDYGPCQVYFGEPAEPGPHYERCPATRVRPGQAFPRWWDAGTTADVVAVLPDGKLSLYPGTGKGSFGRASQIGRGWGGMSLVSGVGDLDKDGFRDLVGRDSAGVLWLYRGDGKGGFLARLQIGKGWNGMDTLVGAGDVDLDGTVDLVARRTSDGALFTYLGNGKGAVRFGAEIGNVADSDLVQAVGDWDGDSRPDLITRTTVGGALMLRSGDGRGGFAEPVQIGRNWTVMTALIGPGDFDGDGTADLLARREGGELMLYAGRGDGGFGAVTQVGSGWSALRLVS